MKHVVYYEPDYDTTQPNLWQLRGRYKYPSIIGDLHKRARVTLLMHNTPPKDDPHRIALERDHGVAFVRSRSVNSPGPDRGERLSGDLFRELRTLGADVLSNLNGRSILYCYASARAAQTLGIRYVMRVGGDDLKTKAHVYGARGQAFIGTREYVEILAQERMAVALADRVIVMTMREQARLRQIANDRAKIDVCYRGVDVDMFGVEHVPPGPCRRFLFIGRKSAEKGYDLLQAAARRLADEHPGISFTFAGTFEPAVEGNCTYLGYVGFEELPALYARHDAVIVCSRTEGFPQVLMEAMSMGLPCIMSRHLFEQDFVDGVTGLFCEVSVEDLSAKITRLVEDDQLYRSLAERSLQHAHDHFAQDRLQRNYHALLLGD